MACITIPLKESFKQRISKFSWVNWSDVGREETMKKELFDKYVKAGTLSDEEWKFCEKIDWHPVDELPLKEEFKKEMERRKKEKSIKLKSVSEIFKNIK